MIRPQPWSREKTSTRRPPPTGYPSLAVSASSLMRSPPNKRAINRARRDAHEHGRRRLDGRLSTDAGSSPLGHSPRDSRSFREAAGSRSQTTRSSSDASTHSCPRPTRCLRDSWGLRTTISHDVSGSSSCRRRDRRPGERADDPDRRRRTHESRRRQTSASFAIAMARCPRGGITKAIATVVDVA